MRYGERKKEMTIRQRRMRVSIPGDPFPIHPKVNEHSLLHRRSDPVQSSLIIMAHLNKGPFIITDFLQVPVSGDTVEFAYNGSIYYDYRL